MTNFRKLCSAFVLTLVLALSALAGETSAPPCPDPGESNGPPCVAAGETQGPSFTATENTESVALEILLFGIQSMLPEGWVGDAAW